MSTRPTAVADGIWTYLKSHKQTDLLPEIIKLLSQKVVVQNETAQVFSPHQLDQTDIDQISQILKEKWNFSGQIEFLIDPKLLAGLKVKLGDKILDLSVQGKLENVYAQI